MKILLITSVSLLTLVGAAQLYMKTMSGKIEQYPYSVIKEFNDFEIRKYEAALFSTVNLSESSYDESASKGFRQLAGYIFGDNEQGKKIAMTSPVAMEMDSTTKMMFMVPAEYSESDLPKPTNKNIRFERREAKTMAAVRFGGWANDKKIKEHEQKLTLALKIENIATIGKFMYLGYNAPYEMINRRNEVVVEVEYLTNRN
jgi:hypothetical protein